MSKFNYPLLLEPIAVPRPWGGGRLVRLYARKSVTSAEPIGESWELSTWPTDPGNPQLQTVSKIINGPLAGSLLDSVADVGVVVKLLDSAERLSVQVHPVSDDVHKDEMWYILHAEPDAFLYCGLKDGVSPAEFCDLVKSADTAEDQILGKLQTHTNLHPGMHFNVPSGTIHAVGPGVVAYEVSECTQITYRLYDYNRGRALHIEDGCRATQASRAPQPPLQVLLSVDGAQSQQIITQFPTFSVIKVVGNRVKIKGGSQAHLLTPTRAFCSISGPQNDWDVRLEHASTCLVPAVDFEYEVDLGFGRELLITALDM